MGISWSTTVVLVQYLICGLWRQLPSITTMHPYSFVVLLSALHFWVCILSVHQHQASVHITPWICNSSGQLLFSIYPLGAILKNTVVRGYLEGMAMGKGSMLWIHNGILPFLPSMGFSIFNDFNQLWNRFWAKQDSLPESISISMSNHR